MANEFLTDIGRTALIFAIVYFLAGLYIVFKTKRQSDDQFKKLRADCPGEVKKLFRPQYSLGIAAIAGIVALLFASSLAGIVTIGGFFMGLLYMVFSKRP